MSVPRAGVTSSFGGLLGHRWGADTCPGVEVCLVIAGVGDTCPGAEVCLVTMGGGTCPGAHLVSAAALTCSYP